jgi:hypothetical protein
MDCPVSIQHEQCTQRVNSLAILLFFDCIILNTVHSLGADADGVGGGDGNYGVGGGGRWMVSEDRVGQWSKGSVPLTERRVL